MKIAIFHPKTKPMPPTGYSPVESVIWETAKHLKRLRHKVTLLEFDLTSDIVDLLENRNYDFCHIHYDKMFMMVPVLTARYPYMKIGMSSHYSHIQSSQWRRIDRRESYYNWMIRNKDVFHFPVSEQDKRFYLQEGILPHRINRLKLGVAADDINFTKVPSLATKTICLGKITQERGQFLVQNLPSVEVVGPVQDDVGFEKNSSYLGCWSQKDVFKNLTNYGSMILLSTKESKTPTVIKEALCAGLGIVTTESCAQELDVSQPFIDIIPDNMIYNKGYVKKVILENRMMSIPMRHHIRDYGMKEFAWSSLIKDYEQSIKDIVKQ